MEYHSAITKNEIMPSAATWMDLEIIVLSKISQKEKDKYDITYMWNLKKKMIQMNLFTKQKWTHTHIENKNLWLPKGKGAGGEIN